MTKMILVALVGLCIVLAICGCLAVDYVSESDQKIASMELNQSAGNMTGEDYLVALMCAYANDSVDPSSESFFTLETEAGSKFPEFADLYREIYNYLGGYGKGPRTGDNVRDWASLCIDGLYHGEGALDLFSFEDKINKARDNYQKRITEEAEKLRLDTDHKAKIRKYNNEIYELTKASRFEEALNVSARAINESESPDSNYLMAQRGATYEEMGLYGDAVLCYREALSWYKYNDSVNVDYRDQPTETLRASVDAMRPSITKQIESIEQTCYQNWINASGIKIEPSDYESTKITVPLGNCTTAFEIRTVGEMYITNTTVTQSAGSGKDYHIETFRVDNFQMDRAAASLKISIAQYTGPSKYKPTTPFDGYDAVNKKGYETFSPEDIQIDGHTARLDESYNIKHEKYPDRYAVTYALDSNTFVLIETYTLNYDKDVSLLFDTFHIMKIRN